MLELDHAALAALLVVVSAALLASLDKLPHFRALSTRRVRDLPARHPGDSVVSDTLSKVVVRKVKVSKVGEYLIVTLVLRTGVESGTEVEIEEPLVVLTNGDVVSKNNLSQSLSV